MSRDWGVICTLATLSDILVTGDTAEPHVAICPGQPRATGQVPVALCPLMEVSPPGGDPFPGNQRLRGALPTGKPSGGAGSRYFLPHLDQGSSTSPLGPGIGSTAPLYLPTCGHQGLCGSPAHKGETLLTAPPPELEARPVVFAGMSVPSWPTSGSLVPWVSHSDPPSLPHLPHLHIQMVPSVSRTQPGCARAVQLMPRITHSRAQSISSRPHPSLALSSCLWLS